MKILLIGLCLFLGFLKFNDYKIAINKTPSLPYTLFISKPFDVIEKNSIVAFSMPQCTIKFCKIVAGVPGDKFSIDQGTISINDTSITNLPEEKN